MTENAQPEIVEVPEATTAVIRGTVPMSDLANFFDDSFRVLGVVLAKQRVTPTGAAFALYHGIPDESVTLEVGFPTDGVIEPDGSAGAGSLPGGRVVRVIHAGSFDGLGDAWQRLGAWIGEQGLEPSDDFWEVYLTEPSPEMDPADLRTELNWPVS